MMAVLKDMLGTVRSVALGLAVTLRNLFRPPVTIQYPDEQPDVPLGYRGIPVLLSDDEGTVKCVSCNLCVKACPVDCIELKAHRGEDGKKVLDVYNIDSTWCMYCGLCVEACPFDALAMSDQFELAAYDLPSLVYSKEQLVEIGRRAVTSHENIRETQMFGVKTGPAKEQAPAPEDEGERD